ncbi:glycosyl hydrolase [Paenibacillus rhizovicinus]|uniref:Glycosyl hydrolase n=1 Tax=Paenibacillus rhizovicinus TaxID=2704463 RepID=A0A6C0P021_9BACL|nr:glycosyl hydrolase family 18 protein [Paenibacillus rhizovicinus]QHW31818.1 glycosyl hydrolase [Paenibacillus rhizovicinus]
MSGIRRSKRKRLRNAWGLGFIAAAIAVVSAYAVIRDRSSDEPAAGSASPNKLERSLSLSAWIVDWQWEAGMKDFGAASLGLDSVQAFAAYFNSEDELYFTEKDSQSLPEVLAAANREGLQETLLTVVNDRFTADGSSSEEKDPALVRRLMKTQASRDKHMGNLLGALDKFGFGGLELDYERIPDGSWGNYTLFIRDLYERLHAEGKSLRVVLESRAPLNKLSLPKGPEYVMMAYNLYGGFSGPGPKADDTFIAQLSERMTALPGDNAIALSLGGFDWTADRQATSVTEQQAAELSRSSGAEAAVRDGASGSLHFRYKDGEGVTHTVWYADTETLKRWIGVVRNAGMYKVALWRLGGLSEEMTAYLKQAR